MSDRYELKGKIGQGGIGAVYRAFDTKLQRHVAIKRVLPLPEEDRNKAAAEALKKEASIISGLQNPNIVIIFDAGSDEDGPFVVMELIEGQTLDRIVRHAALEEQDFVELVNQSLGGLISAHHAGLLHRDLKPKNIMITWLPSGNFQLKILDFGLAKFSVSPTLQTVDQSQNIMGSVSFMAPEQFERRPLDPRTDLYAMGCIYYFSLSQKYPFPGETPGQTMSAHLKGEVKPLEGIRKELNPAYSNWVMRMMSREPDDRPADARTALEEFNAIETAPVAPLAKPILTSAPIAKTIPIIAGSASTGLVAATGPVTAKYQTRMDATSLSSSVPVPVNPSKDWKKVALFTTLALVPLIGLLAVSALKEKKPSPPKKRITASPTASGAPKSASTPKTRPATPPGSALPSAANLAAHYIASENVFQDLGKTKTRRGGRVQTWHDLAVDVAGNSIFKADTKDAKLKPISDFATARKELNGSHPVVRFRRGESLVAGGGKSSQDKPPHTGLTANELTYFLVFKSNANAGKHRVLSIERQDSPPHVLLYRGKGYRAGFAPSKDDPDQRGIHSSTECKLGQFILLTFVWDGDEGLQFSDITLPDGNRVEGTRESVKVKESQTLRYRIGQPAGPKARPEQQFAGEIAELILYNRALPDTDRKTVETYLFKKYFGLRKG